MPKAVVFTAPCDHCSHTATWTQRESAGFPVVLPSDFTVRCPNCDETEVAA
jgi:endogenous inhibitor of DNA gyrase (YacG/DUF329 family)